MAIIGTLIVLFRWIRPDVRDLRLELCEEIRSMRREVREMENALNASIDALLGGPRTQC